MGYELQSSGNYGRLASKIRRRLDRLMFPAPVVVADIDCLHRLMVLEALAVGIGKPGKAPQGHAVLLVERFDMRRTNLLSIGFAEYRFLLR